ncbi:hypothetical protein [Gemmata sp.]|uniref:hypothetical protein n=1 Tax=Gemmata sp. TaxID=1914242 RepID=UPI003F7154D4
MGAVTRHPARKDFTSVRAAVNAGSVGSPGGVGRRGTRSHVPLANGSPPGVLAARAVLEVDPKRTQARQSLRVPPRNTGRWVGG